MKLIDETYRMKQIFYLTAQEIILKCMLFLHLTSDIIKLISGPKESRPSKGSWARKKRIRRRREKSWATSGRRRKTRRTRRRTTTRRQTTTRATRTESELMWFSTWFLVAGTCRTPKCRCETTKIHSSSLLKMWLLINVTLNVLTISNIGDSI